MYAVVRRYAGAAALADALIQHEAEVSVLLRGVPGFKAYYALRSATDTVVTMTICENQAGAQESSRRAAEWVRNNLTGLSIGPPEIVEGETFLSL
jgi:hypothetical protein